MHRTRLARIRRVEIRLWERMKHRFDAMTDDALLAWMDEHYGVEARVWALAYLDALPVEELDALDGPPQAHNAAQRRFNEAYARWRAAQP